MIRLTRPQIPPGHAARSSKGAKRLWDEWRATGIMPKAKASIYAHPDVKKTLRVEAQHNKCAYCETLNPTSHDVVEHFRPKNGWKQKAGDRLHPPAYFWLSYEWENLLFACDRCNDGAHKGNLFPLSNPSQRAEVQNPSVTKEKPLLIDPYTVDPARHIDWNRDIPRPRNGSRRGRVTIEVLALDQDGLLADERRQFLKDVEAILNLVESSPPNNATRQAVVQQLLDCLKDSAPWTGMIRSNFHQRILAL